MNESEKPAPPIVDVVRAAPRHSSLRAWLWLLLVVALAAGGWFGYQAWLLMADEAARRQQTLARLESEIESLKDGIAAQQQKQVELAGAVTQLGVLVEGGRGRVQLAAVEQLLLLANDRLLLARDVGGARRALQLADQRIAALEEPRLLPVREALAAELAALAALPETDTPGAALALAQIMRDAPRFALRARVRERFEAASADVFPPPDAGAAQRVWSAIKTALSAIFTLRRSEGPALRLLAPEEEELAARILQLKLEGARIALLSGDGAAFNDLARGARDWLLSYYNDGDPAVSGAVRSLERLAALQLNPPAPDISGSLALLRARLE